MRSGEGWRAREPELAARQIAALDALEVAYGPRVVPIDGPVVAEWTRLSGAKDENRRDRALAAMARVHGFILATCNIADIRGCGVLALDPFRKSPTVALV